MPWALHNDGLEPCGLVRRWRSCWRAMTRRRALEGTASVRRHEWAAIPHSRRSGAAVRKKDQRPRRSHVSLRDSRSSILPARETSARKHEERAARLTDWHAPHRQQPLVEPERVCCIQGSATRQRWLCSSSLTSSCRPHLPVHCIARHEAAKLASALDAHQADGVLTQNASPTASA